MLILKNVSKVWNSSTVNTWFSFGAKALNLVILTPFILNSFSPQEITLWYIFGTINSLSILFDLGFGVTFIRNISYANGGVQSLDVNNLETQNEPNLVLLDRIWKTVNLVYSGLSLGVFLVLISLGTYMVYNPIVHLSNPKSGFISWGIIILGTTVSFWGNIFSTFLQGIGKITVFRRFEGFFAVLAIITTSIAILLKFDFVVLILVSQFWNIISVVRNRKLAIYYTLLPKKIFSKFRIEFDKEIFANVWKSSWRSALGVLMSYGIMNISTLFFAQENKSQESASFLFAFRMLQLILTFSQAPFYSKIPEMAKMYAQNEKDKVVLLAQKGMSLSLLVYSLGVIFLGLFAPILLTQIKSNIGFLDPWVWSLISIAFFIERYGAMHMQLYSIGNNIIWHIVNGITGAILLVSLYLLYPRFGIISFPISMILSYLSFYSWYSAKKSYELFSLRFFSFERKASLFPFLLIIIFVVYEYYIKY